MERRDKGGRCTILWPTNAEHARPADARKDRAPLTASVRRALPTQPWGVLLEELSPENLDRAVGLSLKGSPNGKDLS